MGLEGIICLANRINISFSSPERINVYFSSQRWLFLRNIMYGGGFMLANQFQLMIHYSLMHFLWSGFQVVIMKQESADTVLSAWSKLAFGWPAVFRANLYCERKSSSLNFRVYYCHNLLTLYLLQMSIPRLKLNASILWK